MYVAEVESRTQGSRPRPRTQKKSEAKAKDTKKIRGQGQGQPFRGQTLSRPRTGMLQGHKHKWSLKKKRSSQKFFRRSSQKNVFQKIFQALHKNLTIQKKCYPRAEDRPIFEDLRPRGQGQGLQNVSSRTPPLVCCTRKMFKKNWNWRNNGFLSHFYDWWHFNRGKRTPLSPLATPMILIANWYLGLFSSRFTCSIICRTVQSARPFFSRSTCSRNMSNQINQTCMTEKNLCTKSKLFFFNAIMFSPLVCFCSA